ncbi:MAG: hypothetical protein DMD34_16515, partial [Gemmatimonadetes bacterium]
GGAAPNAHEELARLLGRLKTPDGKIHIPGLYASVKRPSQLELATWKRLPFKEGEFLKHRVQAKALTGLKAYSVLERLWALPTFEIHGIMGGFTGEGAKTVIPAEATAKVSLRLVPNQRLKVVERQLAAAIRRLAPKHVHASVKFLHGADPATVKVTHPAFKVLDQAFREVVGRGTVPARAGGSIPVVPALGRGGAPVILTGIGLPDDRLHAPNEKLDVNCSGRLVCDPVHSPPARPSSIMIGPCIVPCISSAPAISRSAACWCSDTRRGDPAASSPARRPFRSTGRGARGSPGSNRTATWWRSSSPSAAHRRRPRSTARRSALPATHWVANSILRAR